MILSLPARPMSPSSHRALRSPVRRLAALMAALASLTLFLGACGSDDAGGAEQPTFSFVIPAGAGVDIENGEPLDILPAQITAQLNETIQIVNNDDRAHLLGPWFVGAGETLRQRFTEPGVFDGECSVHPSGEFTIIVEA